MLIRHRNIHTAANIPELPFASVAAVVASVISLAILGPPAVTVAIAFAIPIPVHVGCGIARVARPSGVPVAVPDGIPISVAVVGVPIVLPVPFAAWAPISFMPLGIYQIDVGSLRASLGAFRCREGEAEGSKSSRCKQRRHV